MITGVALIGIVTATLASWIVDRVRDETDKRADEAESETEQLRHNVRELTDTVNSCVTTSRGCADHSGSHDCTAENAERG